MDKKKINDVANFIAAFLVDRTGNDIFDKWKEKRKIKKILTEDRKNIKKIFYAVEDSDFFNLIEEYIVISVFREVKFYSPMNLNEIQENELWESFSTYMREETNDRYVDISYKDKIVRCVNLHNNYINNIMLDSKSRLYLKKQQNQYETIENELGKIINTLSTETKLQENDDELAFETEQMESIMISYKYDINQLGKKWTLGLYGIIVVALLLSLTMSISIEYIQNLYVAIFMLLFFLLISILEWALFRFLKNTLQKIRSLEGRIEEMRYKLWEIHFELFKEHFKEKYIHKDM